MDVAIGNANIHSEPQKRDILFLTITLANVNGFFYSFYIIFIVKKFYMRL